MWIPSLTTERLALRPWLEDDAGGLYRLWTHPEVRCHMWDGEVIGAERAARTVREMIAAAGVGGAGCWTAAALSRPGEVIGFCSLRSACASATLELLVAFLPRYWGRGFGAEACSAALAYAFGQGCERVLARTSGDNVRSIGMIERIGMRVDASTWIDDSPGLCFSLSREQFDRRRRRERARAVAAP